MNPQITGTLEDGDPAAAHFGLAESGKPPAGPQRKAKDRVIKRKGKSKLEKQNPLVREAVDEIQEQAGEVEGEQVIEKG